MCLSLAQLDIGQVNIFNSNEHIANDRCGTRWEFRTFIAYNIRRYSKRIKAIAIRRIEGFATRRIAYTNLSYSTSVSGRVVPSTGIQLLSL